MDKDGSLLEWMHRIGAGFAVVGTVLAEPHTGNRFVLGASGVFDPPVPGFDATRLRAMRPRRNCRHGLAQAGGTRGCLSRAATPG